MKKKPPILPPPARPDLRHLLNREWHNGADVEIHLYARSLQQAAKILIERLDWNEAYKTAWDVGPIILLYRQAIELLLKAVVAEGGRFLPSPTDHITLFKTHSLRWLAQIVCQIIKTVRWEDEFKCEGISNLADFSALIAEIETIEPVSCAVHAPRRALPGEIPEQLRKANVLKLIPRLDALVDLLNSTADSLGAEWEIRSAGITEDDLGGGSGFEPTVQ